MVHDLENWCYIVEFGCGYDKWRLHGDRNGRAIFTSTPVEFDEVNGIVTTASGSKYRLGNCAGNEEKQKQYIRDDVNNGGTRRL